MSSETTERTISVPTWTTPDRLRKSLDHAELEVEEMAEWLEVHPTTIRNWIAGRTRPRPSDLKQWAQRVHVPYEWLVGNETSGSHIRALIRDQQPGYAEVDNDISAMRKALGHDQRRPNARAQLADMAVIRSSDRQITS